MNIAPLKSLEPKPFAYLQPGTRQLYVETENGATLFKGRRSIEKALVTLKGFTCYVGSNVESMKHTTGATSWTLSTWRGRETRIRHEASGLGVTSLRGTLADTREPFEALLEVAGWLNTYGVNMGSISSMSWNLLRASLDQDIRIGADPRLGSASFFGPRQEVREPKKYHDFQLVDIHAAYPSSMSRRPVALSLAPVSASSRLDPDLPGIASAIVDVPSDLPFPPLPVRVSPDAIQFQHGRIKGVWSWCELDAARSLGCDVTILKAWAPRRSFDLFGPWWEIAQSGRSLSPAAANLAKAIANNTWGQFAMTGDRRSEVRWHDDKGEYAFETPLEPRVLPHARAMHVASETTARVRVQTLIEGAYGTDSPPVHIDTDGVIIPLRATPPANSGSGFGQWRVKETMTELEIRAPQFYRWRNKGEEWHYVASGMNEASAIATFSRPGSGFLHDSSRVAVGRYDAVLPPCHAEDRARIEALLKEARSRGVAA